MAKKVQVTMKVGPRGGAYYISPKTGRKVYGKPSTLVKKAKAEGVTLNSEGEGLPKSKVEALSAADREAQRKSLQDHSHKVKAELSEDEVAALQAFASEDFESINNALRFKPGSSMEDFTGSGRTIQATADHIDEALSNQVVPHDVEVYRGIKGHLNVQVGESFRDKGYASTSANPGVAESFVGQDAGVIMRVKVPKGANGIYMGSNYHQPGNKDFDLGEEQELLLPRDTKMRVLSRTDRGGRIEIHVEVEPPAQAYVDYQRQQRHKRMGKK